MRKLKITEFVERNKPVKEKSDLILMVKNAYEDIQINFLSTKSLNELTHVVKLSDLFKMPLERTAVFVSIYCLTEEENNLTERKLYKLLKNYFLENVSAFRIELRYLKKWDFLYRHKGENGDSFLCVHYKFVEALDENNVDYFTKIGPHGLESALEYFKKKGLDQDVLSEREADGILDDIQSVNKKLSLVKYCDDNYFFLFTINAFLLFGICAKALVDADGFDFSYMDVFINYGRNNIQYLRQSVLDEKWEPIADGYVEIVGGNRLENNPVLRLTNKGYEDLLKELDPVVMKAIRAKMGAIKTPMILSNQIQKVNLFFNPTLLDKTQRIQQLLLPEEFQKYQDSFPKNAKMKGITMLFHGGPGCGKTEFALQLSKLTGRPLMKIQVTDFQSKWVGESESQLKAVFRDYRMAYDRMQVKPILFLNECDQIIGKRIEISSSVDQMTNALQNILLEEMENFNGIMIGTTNLTKNMDSAFERRWIMKVLFESPNAEAKKSIWKSAIKGLRAADLETLVAKYDLTPGEITNISRRFAVEKLLGLRKTKLETIMELCDSERYESQEKKIGNLIGFSLDQKVG